jgi:hypothetical protein
MTGKEWLECTDPQKMLEFLRGKASDRRMRLRARPDATGVVFADDEIEPDV